MKTSLTLFLSVFTLVSLGASANTLDTLHPTVKLKVEKYCPTELTQSDVEMLRTTEIQKINDIPYFAEDATKIPSTTERKLVLCSGRYAKNRSTPALVTCTFCKVPTDQGLVTISTHITKEVDELVTTHGLPTGEEAGLQTS